MPRIKKKVSDEVETSQIVQDVDPQDAKVKKILLAMPGGVKCMAVYRYPEGNKGGRPQYIDDISPDQFSHQSIKQMYGGGRFYVSWDNEDGTISKSNFDIAGPYRKLDGDEEEASTTAKSEPEKTDSQEVELFAEWLAERQAKKEADHNRNSTNQNGGISPIDLIKLLHEAEEKGENRMMKMFEMMRPQSQTPDMTKQVFDIVEKVVSMTGQAGGDGGNPWITTLALFKEPLTKIVDTIQTAVNRPVMSNPPHVPASRPAQVQAVAEKPAPQPNTEEDMLLLLISKYLPMLVEAAANGEDASIYSDMILAKVPQSQYASLYRWLAQPDCLDRLVQIAPPIQYQKEWWISLRQTLAEGLNDALQPATTSEESTQD